MIKPVSRAEEGVRMLDQRRLPAAEEYLVLRTEDEVADAIRDMVVRGAPAIGIAAAYGMALAATRAAAEAPDSIATRVARAGEVLAAARPTAVNLFWAIDTMTALFEAGSADGLAPDALAASLERRAVEIDDADLDSCRAIGRFGAELVPDASSVLTHCNAGGLATAGYGTALGVVRGAIEAGKRLRVLADETRPFLQGSRLTAWELMRDSIDTVLITDNMAGSLMRRGEIDLVVVGADRIAANGDVANKIGTYSVAVLAKEHRLPFYVAAPLTTIDRACPDGDAIPIEERPSEEVVSFGGTRVAPEGVAVRNPAFDVTPAALVTAIVTDRGIARPPYGASLAALFAESRGAE